MPRLRKSGAIPPLHYLSSWLDKRGTLLRLRKDRQVSTVGLLGTVHILNTYQFKSGVRGIFIPSGLFQFAV